MNGIIPAAGKGVRFKELGKNYPKCILPVKGKPIIYWNIKELFSSGCGRVFVVVSHKKEKIEEVLRAFFPEYFDGDYPKIILVDQLQLDKKGLSVALISAMRSNWFDLSAETMIALGDLTFESYEFTTNLPLNKKKAFVSVERVEGYKRWCMVSYKKKSTFMLVDQFIDKPTEKPETEFAVSGVYFFPDSRLLYRCLDRQLTRNFGVVESEYQFSGAMRLYNKEQDIFAVTTYNIKDYGTLEEYLENKELNMGRSFNEFDVTPYSVTKRSDKKSKLLNEVNWFRSLPMSMTLYTPRVFDYSFDDRGQFSYTMERLRANTLREVFLFMDSSTETWENIFKQLLDLMGAMKTYSAVPGSDSFLSFVLQKTEKRMPKEESFHKIFREVVNGYIRENGEIESIIHGDYCFSNIMYDLQSDVVKLIDPRGQVFGSPYYDLAKLFHSVLFNYDFIDQELYLHEDGNGQVTVLDDGKKEVRNLFLDMVEERYEPWEIDFTLWIVASLFLSMIPLHSHNPVNQKLFYATYKKLFDFLNGFKGEICTVIDLKVFIHSISLSHIDIHE